MHITFHGAARVVTGSKHLLELKNGIKVLLDCGMYQGMGKDTDDFNRNFGFDPATVNYVVISHAHIDHTGLLPRLVNGGYRGKIYCTPATADLIKVMLLDSAHIQESDVKYTNKRRSRAGLPREEPLYTQEDAAKVFPLLETLDYNQPLKLTQDIELTYTDCGHIIGSAAVHLKINEDEKQTMLTFSGDIGRFNDVLLNKPAPFQQSDYIIMESTYGDKLHPHLTSSANKLLEYIVQTCLVKKGKLIIPSFSVGRTQELLYFLNGFEQIGKLPKLDYYVDSPLSIEATEATRKHPECFNKDVRAVLKTDKDIFGFTGLRFIKDAEESKGLNEKEGPCVIISASGMAEAGRVKHHIKQNIGDSANTILIVGYCEPESLGGRLMAGAKNVNIFGERHQVAAQVSVIESLSAHGDYEDMIDWLACQKPALIKKLFLVHGEYEVQQNFKERLVRRGFADVEIPELHQTFELP